MRVVAVASSAQLGGAELSLLEFVRRRPRDLDVSVVVVLGDGPLRERLEALGVEVQTAPELATRPSAAAAARFAVRLTQLLRGLRPQVVWASGIKAATLAAAPSRLAGVPMLWHKVDFSHDGRLAKPLAAASSGVVPVSAAVGEALGPLRARRLRSVVGPVLALDESLRAEPDPEHPVIGTLGRLVPYKGHHLVIEAAAILSDEFPDLRVVLAGGPAREYPGYPDELRATAARRGLDGRVELPGFVPAPDVLRRLSVYLNPTFRDEQGFGLEGLGASMVEASWAGVPVVASAGGGVTEALVPGVTGTLVPSAEPELIAEAVGHYLRDPELAARTAASGREFARERYAPDTVVRKLVAELERAAR